MIFKQPSKMTMEVYNSFNDKKKIFIHTLVLDIDTLKLELEKFLPITRTTKFGTSITVRYFFRGVSNSTYKIYSSMQRCCCDRNNNGQIISMTELSEEIIRRFNNNVILTDALNKEVSHPSNNSDLAKWAFIQHFGGPSHFVDFTPDLNSALFFALPNPSEETHSDNLNDLNNYISLYVYPDNPDKNGNLNLMYQFSSQRGRDLVSDTSRQHPDITIDTTDADREMLTQPIGSAFWDASIYGKDIFQITLLGDGSKNKMTLSNSHIVKQKGNFFLGKSDEVIPLELAPNLRNAQWDSMGEKHLCPYGFCLDIHKSLIPKIKQSFSIPDPNNVYTSDDYIAEAKA